MLRRDGEFMTLEELDHMAVYLNYIHRTPLSEFGSGKHHDSARGYFFGGKAGN
jgi:hypothetical protein